MKNVLSQVANIATTNILATRQMSPISFLAQGKVPFFLTKAVGDVWTQATYILVPSLSLLFYISP